MGTNDEIVSNHAIFSIIYVTTYYTLHFEAAHHVPLNIGLVRQVGPPSDFRVISSPL
jgi:hypothetical protein